MTDKYYLVIEDYKDSPVGTVIKNVKYKNDRVMKSSVIEIEKSEASYLTQKKIDNRKDLHVRGIYKKLKNLDRGDRCYFKSGLYTILSKNKSSTSYKIVDENGVERNVTLDEIEPYESVIIHDRKVSTISRANYSFYVDVQCPEFVKDMYLSEEFDTTMVKQEAVDDLINKLVYVNDLNPIYGRVRIAFSLSDESLIGIELDPLYVHSNHEQFIHIPLHENIVSGKSLIVVKRKSIHNFTDQLPYKEGSCFVDYSRVKVVEQYESEKHKVDDLVAFHNGKVPTFGIIKKCVLLNGIPCVLVVNTPNSSVTTGNYIPEDAVTLVDYSDDAHGVSSSNKFSTTVDGLDVSFSSKEGIPDNTDNGRVNDDLSIERGRKYKSLSGIEGISRDNKLSDNLIILDNIKRTCGGIWYILRSHNTLDTSFNDRIVVSSICCVKRLPQLREKTEIRVGSKVKKINNKGQIYGICRWIGLVNGVEVIGVETGRCSDGDADNNTIVYLEGSSNKIQIFKSKDISLDYGSEQLKVDDIVRYTTDGRSFYGRIVRIKTVNKVRTVGVVNSITIKDYYPEPIFYREDEVSKMIVDESSTKYIDNTIIDPRSIVTLSGSNNDQFNIGAEVEFEFKTKKYQGKIHLMVETNGKQSAVIALEVRGAGWISRGIEDSDLCQYRFNQIISFEDSFNLEGIIYVIVALNALRILPEKIMRCTNNNISIFNPLRVDTISNATKDNKTIIFKSNGTRIIAALRWRGSVNGEECIGCELKHKSDYGTNGRFGKEGLFECTDGHGALIPLDKIEQCCVQPQGLLSRLMSLVILTHAPLATLYNGSIVGSTICCVDQLEVLPNNQQFKLGSRVMRKNGNEDIFGICRWIGMVNGDEVIGVEMIQCSDGDYDKFVDELALFKCPSNKTALFIARDCDCDSDGLCLCSKNKCIVMDNNNITRGGNGRILNSTIICTINNAIVTKNIKWKGLVNGISCVGYELTRECTCGTNGVFGGKKLFECLPGTGVLIPVNRFFGSCVQDGHKELIMDNDNIIDLDSICCFEPLSRINKWPSMETGSKLKYRSDSSCHRSIGNCKWMGLLNGVESIGANMKEQFNEEIIKKKWFVDIFQCKDGRGALFMADTIEHDNEGEKLPVMMDQFVNVTNLWKVKNMINGDTRGMTVGDYVCTRLSIGDMDQVLNGELKWMGVINNAECVGIDLEDECNYGMNGVINGKHRFECLPRHGVVTTKANVQKYDDLSLRFTNDGMIDASKYLRCQNKWNKDYLAKKNVSKDVLVFVIINNDGRLWKRKGTLRWSGTMNGECVAVVELDRAYDNGTDGRFWRQQLINCEDKKAIAVLWDDVHEYTPFQKKDIPEDKRIFKQISINSAVLLYMPQGGVVKNFYGTVRWSGVNKFDEYYYGIELDDRYSEGTDGHFLGQELFHCENYYGILASMFEVTPDERFIEIGMSVEAEIMFSSAKNTYFESTIIDPRSLITAEMVHSDEWIYDTNVEFVLNESNKKYYGSLKWTGLINKIQSAIVYVETIESDDPIRNYLCSKDVVDRMKIPMIDNMVIVLLTTLQKSQIKEENNYLKRIFEFINDKDVGVSILMEIINKEDTRLLRTVIKQWDHPIELDCYPELLPKLIGQLNYDVIAILLDNFINCHNANVHLLNIAKYFLVKRDYGTFIAASRKCTDVNIILDHGDTFLTDVMKGICDEDVINRVIGSNIFDLNKTNKYGDSPLVIACKQLMVSIVRLLLDNGATKSYNNNMALGAVLNKQETLTDMVMIKKAFEIINILTSGIRLEQNECKICRNGVINVVFSCGHTICDTCSPEFSHCPDCKQEITERKRLYLP